MAWEVNMDTNILIATLHKFVNDTTLKAVVEIFEGRTELNANEFADTVAPLLHHEALTKWKQSTLDPLTAETLQGQLTELGVHILSLSHPDYPMFLLGLQQPPPLLYVMGDTDVLQKPGIGICGSRKASTKSVSYAERFGKKVAALSLPEISGYAKGVDTQAHLGALGAGGYTIVVLAEGILNFRLKKPFRVLPHVLERMIIVSQFHPSRPWHVSNAMKRNKTICGLAKGLVVVEAQASGGTLNAGEECLRQKKPLLVIEYDDSSEMPEGNTRLIGLGGIPVRSAQELANSLVSIKDMDATNRGKSQSKQPRLNLFGDRAQQDIDRVVE